MSTDGLHFDITADGGQADAELASMNSRLSQLESAFKGTGDSASYSTQGFELARESLANYDRGIQRSIELQQRLRAEGKDTDALRTEQAGMLKGYAAEATALTAKRMAEIKAEAEAQKLSVAQQIAALEELKLAVAGSAINVSKIEGAIARLGGSIGIFGGLKKGVQDLEEHSRTAAIAFNAMGMGGEAAVAKVAGLGQLLNGMGSAVPGLLAAGAALVGIFALFEGMKSSAAAAAEWDQRLAILGQTVRNQGGDWQKLSANVKEWADVQEATTQFSRGQAVQGLNELTSTGMKLADAMTVTRVAEDASAASGQSLQSVEHGLMEAMHGRTQALTALGIGTKKSIHDGMAFKDVLKAIEEHMGGAAAAAADTYAGKMKQVQNTLRSLQEDIGSAILPSLTGLAQGMLNLINNAKSVFEQWGVAIKHWMDQHKIAVEGITGIIKGLAIVFRAAFDVVAVILNTAIKEISALASFILDFASGDWKNAWQDVVNFASAALHSFTDLFGNWGDNIITIAERIGEGVKKALAHVFSAMVDASHGDISGAGAELGQVGGSFGGVMSGIKFSPFSDAFSGMQNLFASHGNKPSNGVDLGGLSGDLANTMVGGKTGGASHQKPPFSFDPGEIALKSSLSDTLIQEKDKVTAALDAMKLKEGELQKAMEATTTESGHEAAARALEVQKAKDAQAAVELLTNAVKNDTEMRRAAQQELAKTTKGYQDAYNAWVSYGKSLSEDPSKAQRAHLAELAKSVTHAKTAYDNAYTSLNKVNTALNTHQRELVAANIATDKLKDSVSELARKWDAYYQTQSKNMAEDLAISDMTNEQKYAYFKQLFDQQSRDTAEGEKEAERLFGQELSAYKGMLHDKEASLRTFTDKAVSFLDSFFQKGKKGTETLAKAFQDMIHAMEQALEKSLLMSLLGKLFNVPTQSFGSIFQSNISSAFGLGSLGGSSGAASGAGQLASALPSLVSTPTGSALPVHIAGVDPSLSSGGSGASGGGGGGGFSFLGGGGGFGGFGSDVMGLGIAGLGISLGQKMGGGIGGGIMGALGAGVGLNVALGGGMGLLGGGGLMSMLAMNPLLFGGAMLVGGLLGGIKWGNHYSGPDQTNTQEWGQGLANVQGSGADGSAPMNANGQQFVMNPELAKITGNKGELGFIGDYIRQHPDEAKKLLTPEELQYFTGVTDRSIYDDKGGLMSMNNGQKVDWRQLIAAADDATKKIAGLGQAAADAATPVYNVTHSFPDWNNPQIALGGTYAPGGPSTTGTGTAGSTKPGGGGIEPHRGADGTSLIDLAGTYASGAPPVIVHVNIGGVVGMTKDDLVRTVTEEVGSALARNPQITYMR